MTPTTHAPTTLTDDQLLGEVQALARRERHATVHLIAALTELDRRRLYLGQGYSSLFVYCTRGLHLSEGAAYRRIEAARAAGRFPVILRMLADGALTLTSVCVLSRHLTAANHRAVLDAACHCTKRVVELQVAALQPRPPVLSFVRKVPTTARTESPTTPVCAESELPLLADRAEGIVAKPVMASLPPAPRQGRLEPLAPNHYKLQVTISRTTHDKLRDAQDLMRHRMPNGDLAMLIERALTLLVEDLRKCRWADTSQPHASKASSPHSRHVPAAIKREVWKRDDGRCAFVGTAGRCSERGLLEFHHVVPFADGGQMTSTNLQLRCRAHNAYEAQQYFGEWLTG